MKTIGQKTLESQRSESKFYATMKHLLREIAPIIIPSILFSICIYCCVMEALTFPVR
ncbi:MAG: hypothetical protein NC396_03360 [Bacteroides sp.]|nr:hypothetical protein [Bacteroides sp.]MCM1085265.1 hypothetical protein [Bacteroides sp.]